MSNENGINLLELVKKMPLGLPMPKESVIITTGGNKGKKILYFTMEGYKSRSKFLKWLESINMSPQDWYDKYYLNISSHTQRPKCNFDGCNKECEFRSAKSIGYRYMNFCCHSHCQLNTWRGEGSDKVKEKSRKSKIEYFSDPRNRVIRGIQTKEGFKRNGLYDLDENGLNHFSRTQYKYHSSEKGKENDRRRAESLKKENNPEFSNKMRIVMNIPEVRERNNASVRKSMSDMNLRSHLSIVRKLKFRLDKEFRDNQFKVIKKNSKGKSGFVFSKLLGMHVEYDSTYELAFIMILENDSSVVKYIREPRNLDIKYDLNNEIHWYWPDFLVLYEDRIEMVEIKPINFIEDTIVRLKSESAIMKCDELGYKYHIITENELFNKISKNEVLYLHRYNDSLRYGYKSTNDKIKEMLNIK